LSRAPAIVLRADGLPDGGTTNLFVSDDGGLTLSRIDATGAAGDFSAWMVRFDDGGMGSALSGTFDVPSIACP